MGEGVETKGRELDNKDLSLIIMLLSTHISCSEAVSAGWNSLGPSTTRFGCSLVSCCSSSGRSGFRGGGGVSNSPQCCGAAIVVAGLSIGGYCLTVTMAVGEEKGQTRHKIS